MIQILVMISFSSNGQNKPFDLNEIKNLSRSDSYNDLFIRYKANDTTLSLDDYIMLFWNCI